LIEVANGDGWVVRMNYTIGAEDIFTSNVAGNTPLEQSCICVSQIGDSKSRHKLLSQGQDLVDIETHSRRFDAPAGVCLGESLQFLVVYLVTCKSQGRPPTYITQAACPGSLSSWNSKVSKCLLVHVPTDE